MKTLAPKLLAALLLLMQGLAVTIGLRTHDAIRELSASVVEQRANLLALKDKTEFRLAQLEQKFK